MLTNIGFSTFLIDGIVVFSYFYYKKGIKKPGFTPGFYAYMSALV
ncbi:MAG: hypothetical protein ABFS35_16550 [Bacteroidota bacterium]